jgi:formylglycine-generating enzyme required for sulfatase activity
MKMSVVLLVLGISVPSGFTLAADEAWVEPVSGIAFRPIPKGCFLMGADKSGERYPMEPQWPPHDDERPRHEVCLDTYWLATTETTEAMWERLEGRSAAGESSRPKTDVTWRDVREALRLFRERTGTFVRLPTEAEWEYACRAGADAIEYQPDDDAADAALAEQAWLRETPGVGRSVNDVVQKKPNQWGLFDMVGNAWEFTEDGYRSDGYRLHDLHNPSVKVDKDNIVIRGGSIRSSRIQGRCGERNYAPVGDSMPTVGFRLVLERLPAPAVKEK